LPIPISLLGGFGFFLVFLGRLGLLFFLLSRGSGGRLGLFLLGGSGRSLGKSRHSKQTSDGGNDGFHFFLFAKRFGFTETTSVYTYLISRSHGQEKSRNFRD